MVTKLNKLKEINIIINKLLMVLETKLFIANENINEKIIEDEIIDEEKNKNKQ